MRFTTILTIMFFICCPALAKEITLTATGIVSQTIETPFTGPNLEDKFLKLFLGDNNGAENTTYNHCITPHLIVQLNDANIPLTKWGLQDKIITQTVVSQHGTVTGTLTNSCEGDIPALVLWLWETDSTGTELIDFDISQPMTFAETKTCSVSVQSPFAFNMDGSRTESDWLVHAGDGSSNVNLTPSLVSGSSGLLVGKNQENGPTYTVPEGFWNGSSWDLPMSTDGTIKLDPTGAKPGTYDGTMTATLSCE